MSGLSGWRRVKRLLGRERFASELEEEMAFHREQIAKELEAAGMTPEEAGVAAIGRVLASEEAG